jgi:hypothetical protein
VEAGVVGHETRALDIFSLEIHGREAVASGELRERADASNAASNF